MKSTLKKDNIEQKTTPTQAPTNTQTTETE